jgi:hypothetical protein
MRKPRPGELATHHNAWRIIRDELLHYDGGTNWGGGSKEHVRNKEQRLFDALAPL